MLKALWDAWTRAVNALNRFAATLETAADKMESQTQQVREALPGGADKALPDASGNGHTRRTAKAKV